MYGVYYKVVDLLYDDMKRHYSTRHFLKFYIIMIHTNNINRD